MIKRILISVLMVISAGLVQAADLQVAPDQDLARYEEAYLNKVDAQGMRVIDKLVKEPSPDPLLTKAEQVAIAYYTISYEMEPRIMLAGALKLEKKSGRFFRGQTTGGRINITHEGQILNFKDIVSVSASRSAAEGFLSDPDNSELLIIQARSARDISPYSQCHNEGVDEREHFLLPGTALRVVNIYRESIIMFNEELGKDEKRSVRIVEITEISQ